MNFLKKLFLFVIIIANTSTIIAQKTNVGNWFVYFGNQAINKKFNWWNEVQYRNYNIAGDLQQLLFRTGIGYNLTENNNNILLGYAFVNSQKYITTNSKTGSNEHRIYQQFITKQNFGKIFLQHRYRVEERFLKPNFAIRLRYSASLNIPLNNKKMVSNTWYASAYDEILLNMLSPIFDRNRFYTGIGYVINKNYKSEIGYMTQSLETSKRGQFQIVLINNTPLFH